MNKGDFSWRERMEFKSANEQLRRAREEFQQLERRVTAAERRQVQLHDTNNRLWNALAKLPGGVELARNITVNSVGSRRQDAMAGT